MPTLHRKLPVEAILSPCWDVRPSERLHDVHPIKQLNELRVRKRSRTSSPLLRYAFVDPHLIFSLNIKYFRRLATPQFNALKNLLRVDEEDHPVFYSAHQQISGHASRRLTRAEHPQHRLFHGLEAYTTIGEWIFDCNEDQGAAAMWE